MDISTDQKRFVFVYTTQVATDFLLSKLNNLLNDFDRGHPNSEVRNQFRVQIEALFNDMEHFRAAKQAFAPHLWASADIHNLVGFLQTAKKLCKTAKEKASRERDHDEGYLSKPFIAITIPKDSDSSKHAWFYIPRELKTGLEAMERELKGAQEESEKLLKATKAKLKLT